MVSKSFNSKIHIFELQILVFHSIILLSGLTNNPTLVLCLPSTTILGQILVNPTTHERDGRIFFQTSPQNGNLHFMPTSSDLIVSILFFFKMKVLKLS